jgi:class 3 adenylate cyclase
MTEIIRLQTLLSEALARRFETSATVCFTDIVGSTAYFARFGDARGRQLQQLHVDALERALRAHGGRLVDTAGDGAVSIFADATQAALAMCALQHDLNAANLHRERDHQVALRVGLHHGRVLTDGVQVTGDVMNLCARIAASAEPGQIRLSHDCFRELDNAQRLRCRPLGEVPLKGAGRAMALLSLHWLDRSRFPVAVRVRESGERIDIPLQDIVSFGRLDIIEGMPANDVVLTCPMRWPRGRSAAGTSSCGAASAATPALGQHQSHGGGRPCAAAWRRGADRPGQRGQPVGGDDARLRGRHAAGRHPQRRDDGDRLTAAPCASTARACGMR